MAGENAEAAPDPVSGLPSITLGHPVTSAEVAHVLDEDVDEGISATAAEAADADESTQAAVAASRRMLDALDDEW